MASASESNSITLVGLLCLCRTICLCLLCRAWSISVETVASSSECNSGRWITLHWGIHLCSLTPKCNQFVTGKSLRIIQLFHNKSLTFNKIVDAQILSQLVFFSNFFFHYITSNLCQKKKITDQDVGYA